MRTREKKKLQNQSTTKRYECKSATGREIGQFECKAYMRLCGNVAVCAHLESEASNDGNQKQRCRFGNVNIDDDGVCEKMFGVCAGTA